jgi:tetratricopeptide (TPR) repeat protein
MRPEVDRFDVSDTFGGLGVWGGFLPEAPFVGRGRLGGIVKGAVGVILWRTTLRGMMARRNLGFFVVAAAMLAAPFVTFGVDAQQSASSRYRVLVPDFQPAGSEDKNFGKDLAEELREAIGQLNTHTAVEKDDIKDGLKRFKLKMEDLNCVRSRQLAQQNNYEVVLCASYRATGAEMEVFDIQFVDTRSGESFAVPSVMSARKDEATAAAAIVDEFQLFVEQARRATFCSQYAQSQQWEQSLENCDIALELNPESVSVRYTRANVLRNTERWAESLQEVDIVLEHDPFHQDALLLGGWVANKAGESDRALAYYRRHLELDPANAAVRMNVAYDVATDGDPLSAMALIEDGMAIDPDNINFYNQHGNFAFSAARAVADRNRAVGAEEITPEVRELYLKAIASYQRVMESPDAEIQPSQARNATAAYIQLGDAPAAAEFANAALQQFPDDEGIWMIYSDALREQGMVNEALAALQEVERINPQAAQLHLRMANLMIKDNRLEEAIPFLRQAVENGTPADQAANMIFANAHTKYIAPSQKNYSRFITAIQWAKEFDVSDMARQTYDFWHGYSIFQDAIRKQEPSTLQTAQSTLPLFQRARELFQGAKGYMDSQASIDYTQFVDNSTVYIEIQEAIIKRGR